LKRDDELSCTISGSKLRKLASLQRGWQLAEADVLLACGGSTANHLPALLQIARESAIDCQIWTWGSQFGNQASGNQALFRLLAEDHQINWLKREQWPEVEERMRMAATSLQEQGRSPYLIYEGGKQVDAIWGAMSLAVDLLRNQQEHGVRWQRVFIDSGTGMSAIGLYCGLAILKQKLDLHVVLVAGEQQEFERDLICFREFLQSLGLDWNDLMAPSLTFHKPVTARSFGATNRKIFDFIRAMARGSGVILDPIYSAKLALTAQAYLQRVIAAPGLSLLIHSGGAWTNQGFWGKINVSE